MIKPEEFDDEESQAFGGVPENKRKRYMIIGSRVHPGESPASWMMQGFLKAICSDSQAAVQLRKRIIFKIIPMVNVDGVIVGNYRASCAGIDLNRKYDRPDFRFHPIVWSIKNLTETLNEQSEATF